MQIENLFWTRKDEREKNPNRFPEMLQIANTLWHNDNNGIVKTKLELIFFTMKSIHFRMHCKRGKGWTAVDHHAVISNQTLFFHWNLSLLAFKFLLSRLCICCDGNSNEMFSFCWIDFLDLSVVSTLNYFPSESSIFKVLGHSLIQFLIVVDVVVFCRLLLNPSTRSFWIDPFHFYFHRIAMFHSDNVLFLSTTTTKCTTEPC